MIHELKHTIMMTALANRTYTIPKPRTQTSLQPLFVSDVCREPSSSKALGCRFGQAGLGGLSTTGTNETVLSGMPVMAGFELGVV